MAKQVQAKFIGIRAGSEGHENLIPGELYEVDTDWTELPLNAVGCFSLLGMTWIGGPIVGSEHPDSWVHVHPGYENDGQHKMVFEVRL